MIIERYRGDRWAVIYPNVWDVVFDRTKTLRTCVRLACDQAGGATICGFALSEVVGECVEGAS